MSLSSVFSYLHFITNSISLIFFFCTYIILSNVVFVLIPLCFHYNLLNYSLVIEHLHSQIFFMKEKAIENNVVDVIFPSLKL